MHSKEVSITPLQVLPYPRDFAHAVPTAKNTFPRSIGAIFTQSFLIRNRALHSIESWTFTRCLFLQMDVFAMLQFAHRFAVYHNMALTHKIARRWCEAWDWDALSSDLACATFSWWERSNSFKSLINHFNMCASLGSCACSLSLYILIILFFILWCKIKHRLKLSVLVSPALREKICVQLRFLD